MPEDAGPIVATSVALVRLFTGNGPRVTLRDGVLYIGKADGIPVSAIDSIATRRSWLGTRLTVRVAGGALRASSGLRRQEAARLARAVRADAARAAEDLDAEIARLDARLARFGTTDRYRRASQSAGLQEDIAAVVQRLGGALVRLHLPVRAAEALARIEPLADRDAFEAAREDADSRRRRRLRSRRRPGGVGRALLPRPRTSRRRRSPRTRM